MWSNEQQSARREKGRLAWLELEKTGGLLPLPAECPPYWESNSFWDGMGEFEPSAVEVILKNALPKLTCTERRWPWIAMAAFNYKSDYRSSLARFSLRRNADAVVDAICDHAEQLQDALMDLSVLGTQTPGAIGRMNWEKAWGVMQSIDGALGGAGTALTPDQGQFGFQLRLQKVRLACERHQAPVGGRRLRGSANPSLFGLVMDLSFFWLEATGRSPSTATPSRRDGAEAPFVRLVNGCADLAGAPKATPKQVQGVLSNMPFGP